MNEAIMGEIRETQRKIQECQNALRGVQSIRSNCASKKTEWQRSFSLLEKNDLSQVKKTDLFEGEIAEALCGKVSQVSGEIYLGIAKAGELEGALGSQCTRLEMKIAELHNICSTLYQSLGDE